ncbi:hypothetical protein HFO39_23585 [Rhizobium leguminosarum]|uniref:hypothetical protein n=1 Tax=Rhizobium leguminosarum TaxID=384 RepID=UPI001C95D131|nr:hypothetical protein [Rhizobium leguminosarum]MBY5637714.1 hypothetical protein [Rhizobium leguminosarum]
MKNPNRVPFKAVFSRFKNVLDVINAALTKDVDILLVRHPGDGGPAGWKMEGVRCIVADLASDEEQITVVEEIAARCPDTVIFTTSIQRDEGSFAVEAGEAKVVQELLWLHAGKARSIETYFPIPAAGGVASVPSL